MGRAYAGTLPGAGFGVWLLVRDARGAPQQPSGPETQDRGPCGMDVNRHLSRQRWRALSLSYARLVLSSGRRRSATAVRGRGRRDRGRTDGLLSFTQALYHPELLADADHGADDCAVLWVDLARLEPTASALQARRSPCAELQAQDPPRMHPGRYAVVRWGRRQLAPSGRAGPLCCRSLRSCPSPSRQQRGPSRAPADRVERIQSCSQEPAERSASRRQSPAGQRPTAACWGFITGDGDAGRSWRRRPALRLWTTLSL